VLFHELAVPFALRYKKKCFDDFNMLKALAYRCLVLILLSA
jgi:hypothetical protein